jgi:hypothetical protein
MGGKGEEFFKILSKEKNHFDLRFSNGFTLIGTP